MLDFASALYLGFRHDSASLRPWSSFSTGMPAVIESPRLASVVADDLAALQGVERGTVATSTLHIYWDLVDLLCDARSVVLLDAGAYPIAKWGVARRVTRSVPAREFAHHDAGSLRAALRRVAPDRRPLIVTDGYCPGCGRNAPVEEYWAIAREREGWMVIDDTQALGILGHRPGPRAPYGLDGGGTLRRTGITGSRIVLACSTAKAFGAPLAVLSGAAEVVERFERQSRARMHCSPPSLPALRAAERALALNRSHGQAVRARLATLVGGFRSRLRELGWRAGGGIFPVQTLAARSLEHLMGIHRELLRSGIRTVLAHSCRDGRPQLLFLITACHTLAQLEEAAAQLHRIVRPELRVVREAR